MAGLLHPGLVVLSGAGLSAESGVPTFRGVDGLWEGRRIEEVATPEAFQRQPELVHRFYNLRRAALRSVAPNAAHEALVRLEQNWPGSFLHITQNVDDLNERAGAKKLLHMHGQLRQVRCLWCRCVLEWNTGLQVTTPCPECGRTGRLRPDIVWFGEMPYYIDEITRALQTASVFVCIGSSGVVYPAAGFVRLAAESGCARRIEVNLEPADVSGRFTELRQGPATREVPQLVEELLADLSR